MNAYERTIKKICYYEQADKKISLVIRIIFKSKYQTTNGGKK